MNENNEIKITRANLDAAYSVADEATRKVLDALCGKSNRPTPTLSDYKSIRTYEDACVALGESVDVETLTEAGVPKHIIALMKLELVCKALWGGENNCTPTANGSKHWWYPVMTLWTADEVAAMDVDKRGALLSAVVPGGAAASFGSLSVPYRSSFASAAGGFRLCLDSEEKVEYFGRQFVELWAEYLAYNFTVGERLEQL